MLILSDHCEAVLYTKSRDPKIVVGQVPTLPSRGVAQVCINTSRL